MNRVSIIGLGNAFRGDFGVAFYILESLGREPLDDDVFLAYFGEDPRWAGGLMHGADLAIVLGAFPFGGMPGMIHAWNYKVFEEHAEWMAREWQTVELLLEAVSRADVAGGRPREFAFFWIEPCATEGIGLSKPARKAVWRTTAMIKRKLVDRAFLPEDAMGVSRFFGNPFFARAS